MIEDFGPERSNIMGVKIRGSSSAKDSGNFK